MNSPGNCKSEEAFGNVETRRHRDVIRKLRGEEVEDEC